MERSFADKSEVSSWGSSWISQFYVNNYKMLAKYYILQVESLSKKYEEKYKQTGDVASKLTIEEATFRDIQVTVCH